MRYLLFILFIFLTQVFTQACSSSTENKKDYHLTTSATPPEAGSVSPESGYFNDGDILEITATPNEQWIFEKWTGDLSGTDNPATLTVNKNLDITAMFTAFDTNLVKTFGGSARDEAWAIDYTNDGGMILTGRSASKDGDFEGLSRGEYFSFVLKLNASGEKEWLRTFNGSNEYEKASSIIQSQDGGYLFTGNAYPGDADSNGMGRSDIFVIKLTSTGDTEWSNFFGGELSDSAYDIIETPGGNIMVVGLTSSNNGQFQTSDESFKNAFLLKLAADGSFQWLRKYGGTDEDNINTIDNTEDEGFILAGSTFSDDGDFEPLNDTELKDFVMKVDANGNIEWVKMLTGRSLIDNSTSVITSSDGGYIVSGSTLTNSGDFAGEIDNLFLKPYIIKLDETGQREWLTVYDGEFSDIRSYSIIETPNNDLVITGFSNSDSQIFYPFRDINARIMALKLDAFGTVQWFKTFNGSGKDHGYAAATFNDDSIVIAGSSNSVDGPFTGLNKGDHDIFVIRLNESGELIPFD